MWVKKTLRIEEAAQEMGVDLKIVLEFIQNEWIQPAEPDPIALDEEDIARIRLITQLRGEFGVNDEAVPIILHLLDQLHQMHYQLRKR